MSVLLGGVASDESRHFVLVAFIGAPLDDCRLVWADKVIAGIGGASLEAINAF